MLAAVALPSAMESDALSTALLVVGETGADRIASLRPKMRLLTADHTEQGLSVKTIGISDTR
jgi:hypothetical protein